MGKRRLRSRTRNRKPPESGDLPLMNYEEDELWIVEILKRRGREPIPLARAIRLVC
jgi:hypothetical protein